MAENLVEINFGRSEFPNECRDPEQTGDGGGNGKSFQTEHNSESEKAESENPSPIPHKTSAIGLECAIEGALDNVSKLVQVSTTSILRANRAPRLRGDTSLGP